MSDMLTEQTAKRWIKEHCDVSRETMGRLEQYVELLISENAEQNLVSASTVPHIWVRHIADSAQLLTAACALDTKGLWIDVGSGAGLPAVVVALLRPGPMIWVEPRKRRVEFLSNVVAALQLTDIEILRANVEKCQPRQAAAVVSARAYAPLPRLLETCHHLADKNSLWVLPKGQNWKNELDMAAQSWHYTFHVKQSVTDPHSAVLLLQNVSKKRSG